MFAERGPDNLVCTRVQFKVEVTVPPEPESLEAALCYVTQINAQLLEMLLAQAEKVTLDTLRDTITAITQEITAVCMANSQFSNSIRRLAIAAFTGGYYPRTA